MHFDDPGFNLRGLGIPLKGPDLFLSQPVVWWRLLGQIRSELFATTAHDCVSGNSLELTGSVLQQPTLGCQLARDLRAHLQGGMWKRDPVAL